MPTKVDRQLSRQEVADLAGIKAHSIDAYQKRGVMPPPDGRLGRSPYWLESTVRRWVANRRVGPGKPKVNA